MGIRMQFLRVYYKLDRGGVDGEGRGGGQGEEGEGVRKGTVDGETRRFFRRSVLDASPVTIPNSAGSCRECNMRLAKLRTRTTNQLDHVRRRCIWSATPRGERERKGPTVGGGQENGQAP